MASSFAVLSTREKASEVHSELKEKGLLVSTLKPMQYGEKIAFPVVEGTFELDFEMIQKIDPHTKLAKILNNPPKKWEMLGDLVIFPENTFIKDEDNDWHAVAQAVGGKRLAIQSEVSSGMMRQSKLQLLFGNDGWVIHKENFVDYEFDATKVMFSSGNVTERRRMGELDLDGEIVIDAYCGIGYYTIPVIVNGRAKLVHACEINPDSINGLKKGLLRNNVDERCIIHHGDNRETLQDLRGIADRIILGLIPSSEPTWKLAIDCLKPEGGIIHVHMNVDERKIDQWVMETLDWFSKTSGKKAIALHLEKVKWYCPHIRHIVLDISIS